MRMPADHLGDDRLDHVGECESAGLFGHPRVEHHLKQQVAKLVGKIGHGAPVDGVGDLVCLFDGIGRDGREILRQIPWTSGVRIAQPHHHRDQGIDLAAVAEECGIIGHDGQGLGLERVRSERGRPVPPTGTILRRSFLPLPRRPVHDEPPLAHGVDRTWPGSSIDQAALAARSRNSATIPYERWRAAWS